MDREAGIIYDALLLGTKAKNGRRYLYEAREEAVQRGVYNGLQLYIGPHKKSMWAKRSPDMHAGELFNVRNTHDGVFVDIRINRASRGGQLVLEIAERFPNAFGLSQHALVGGYEDENGDKCITRIAEAAVADLVKDPGTTSGIFEEFDMPTETETVEDVETPVEPADTEEADETWEDCIDNLISEIHSDKQLDDDKKLKATKVLMKLKKDLNGEEDDSEEADDEEEEETPAEEEIDVKKLAQRIKKLEAAPPAPAPAPRRKPRSSARTETATAEEVSPKPKPPMPKTREDILKAYDVIE